MTNLRFVEDGKKDITERKNSLRAYMKEVRAGLDNKDVKAERLTEHTLDWLEKQREQTGKNTVFVYLSFSTEADTDGLIERLQERGFAVYCPKIENGEMHAVRYGDDFTLSKFGIREPVGDKLTVSPDFAITPLLAVDKNGNRLGYGKGYYDIYFKRFPLAERIGYCFACQVRKNLPCHENDVALQWLITEDGVTKIRN